MQLAQKKWALRLLPALACIVIACTAKAQQTVAAGGNALDGHRFAGEFIPEGETSGRADEFIFDDGRFHSRECLKFGFSPGPYWVRFESGRLYFLARLTSEENGVMTYEGSVTGTRIDAAIDWVKPRWYWTMERLFRFEGTSAAATGAGGK